MESEYETWQAVGRECNQLTVEWPSTGQNGCVVSCSSMKPFFQRSEKIAVLDVSQDPLPSIHSAILGYAALTLNNLRLLRGWRSTKNIELNPEPVIDFLVNGVVLGA